MKYSEHYTLYALLLVFVVLGGWGCANMGSPEGGPFDVDPPKLVKAQPEQGALNVKERKLTLRFDEFIKLTGQQEKVIVSPPQSKPARITASGKTIEIVLEDSLRPNTTYSFYFDDAIVDNNEDNALENFSYSISTGAVLDSMQILGTVLDAQTLEPVSGVLLGAYWSSQMSDTTFRTQPFPFVSKSNKMGQFAIRGLRDSVYTIFALKDDDNDFKYSLPNEGIAFDTMRYKTSLLDSIRTDTIRIDSIVRRDTLHRDSLVTYPYTYYYPRNLTLRYFVAQDRRKGLERHQRVDSLLCRLEFAEQVDTIPALTLLDASEDLGARRPYIPVLSGKAVDYWLTDSALINADSVRFSVVYTKTDSLLRQHAKVDTLVFYKPKAKSSASSKKEKERGFTVGLQTSRGAVAKTPADTLMIVANRPLESFADSVVKVEATKDSVFAPVPFSIHEIGKGRMKYRVDVPWKHGHKYKVSVDSARLQSVYGDLSGGLRLEHQVEAEAELGALSVVLQGVNVPDSLLVVELLDKSGQVVMTKRAVTVDSLVGQKQGAEADSVLASLLKSPLATADSLATLGREGQKKLTADTTMRQKPTLDTLARQDTLSAKQPQGEQAKPKSKEKSILASFKDLKPDDYYLRLFVDRNADGVWTTGEYPSRAPEEVYYAPKPFPVKKGFTTQETWSPLSVPLDKQKPEALRKIKPEEKKKRENKNIEYYKRLKEKKGKQTSSSMEMPTSLPGIF